MTAPDDAAETATVATQQIVDDAQRLGLTWTLRPATVTQSSPFQVAYDGDTTTIDAVNLLGNPQQAGRRVMGLIVPPSGNFIIGKYGEDPGEPVTYIDGASTATPSAAFAAETVVLTIGSFNFQALRAYKAEWRFDVLTTSGTNAVVWRIRKTNVAGTVLGVGVFALRNVQSNDCGSDIIVRNTTSTDVASPVVLTMTSTAGNITANAAATQVGWIRLFDVGPSSRFANAIAV